MRKRIRPGLLALLLIVVVAGGSLGGAVVWGHTWQNRILPGVRIESVDVAGLTQEAARAKLALLQERFLTSPVVLTLDGSKWQVTRRELGFQLEVDEAVGEAFAVGRSGSLLKCLHNLWDAWHGRVVLALRARVDRPRAEKVLSGLAGDKLYPPEDARLIISDRDEVVVKPGKPGAVLDYQSILGELSRWEEPLVKTVPLRLRQVQPRVRTRDILAMKITGLLSSYTTYFDMRNTNRTYNINVAADALDNLLIKPGEVFSFNKVVGPRSKEKGYREALVIVDDQFTPGIGGGVCQVSSTLYNTALLAGLEIVERSNHSLPVSYVPLGRDATVAYGGCDLKFRNSTSGYLCLRTRVSKGALTIKVFGNGAEKKEVTLESIVDRVLEPKVIRKEDPNLYTGKTVEERKGVRGYQVRVFRYIKNPDGQVLRKLLSRDIYKPVDQVLQVGTKPLPANPRPPAAGEQPGTVEPQPPPSSAPADQ